MIRKPRWFTCAHKSAPHTFWYSPVTCWSRNRIRGRPPATKDAHHRGRAGTRTRNRLHSSPPGAGQLSRSLGRNCVKKDTLRFFFFSCCVRTSVFGRVCPARSAGVAGAPASGATRSGYQGRECKRRRNRTPSLHEGRLMHKKALTVAIAGALAAPMAAQAVDFAISGQVNRALYIVENDLGTNAVVDDNTASLYPGSDHGQQRADGRQLSRRSPRVRRGQPRPRPHRYQAPPS